MFATPKVSTSSEEKELEQNKMRFTLDKPKPSASNLGSTPNLRSPIGITPRENFSTEPESNHLNFS